MPTRLEQLLKFHAADPNDAFCAYGIAMEYAKARDAAAAFAWFDKTLAIDADYAYAYYQKAKLLGEAGQTADAAVLIDRGLDAARRTGDAHAASELQSLRESF